MNEFLTWEIITTIKGAAAATAIITQAIKRPTSKIPTQAVSYVVALVLLLVGTAAVGVAESWADWAIVPLNAAIVSLTANGAFTAIQRCLSQER